MRIVKKKHEDLRDYSIGGHVCERLDISTRVGRGQTLAA